MSRLLLLPMLVGPLLAAQCSGEIPLATQRAQCRTDPECGAFRFCQQSTGRCLCNDDRACGDGEFCNASFSCQPLAGCQDNTDCELQTENGAPLVCDVKASRCEPAALCFDDSHCPLDHICDTFVGACVAGCRDEADCVLGRGCVRDPPTAVFGRCVQGSCSTTANCPVGSNCDLTTNTCVVDTRGPFCGACQRFDPLNPQCGDDPANYCLIDTGDPTRRGHYCGVDCSQDQGCPNGYVCAPVIIVGGQATPPCGVERCQGGRCSVTGAVCSVDTDCPQGPPGGDCERAVVGVCAGTVDQECSSDADCGGSQGSCRFAECRLRETSAYGFCSCVVDSDCTPDSCRGADLTDVNNPISGHCYLSGHRCYDDNDCNHIACVNGGCLIGENCKPANDRRCADLQTNNGEVE
ncbi:MAG: hypothetical protein AB2A00_40260 [Myxococcota bacterium]